MKNQIPITLLASTLLNSGCKIQEYYPSSIEKSKAQIEAQRSDIQQLTIKNQELSEKLKLSTQALTKINSELASAQSEIKELKQTDVHLWQESLAKEKDLDLQGAIESLDAIMSKFPQSAYMVHVQKRHSELNKKNEELKASENEKFSELTAKLFTLPPIEGKQSVLDFQKMFPNSKKTRT